MFVRQPLSFFRGVRQHALALVAKGQVHGGGNLFPDGGVALDLFTDRLNRSMGPKEPIRQRFVFPQQAQQQVLRFDIRRTKLAGLVACKEDYAPGLFRVPFKHETSPRTRPEFLLLPGSVARLCPSPPAPYVIREPISGPRRPLTTTNPTAAKPLLSSGR